MQPRNADAVRSLLTSHSTLYAGAAAMPGARPIAGRGTAWVITPGDGSWLVRHYHRGGAVARVLGDRYARLAPSRALRELVVSTAARNRGVRTPLVIAAVAYPAGLFKRFDIAVELVPDARDLAEALFGNASDAARDSAERAAALIRNFTARGLVHADLNLKNILVTPADAWVIDLDRCNVVAALSQGQRTAMKQRFIRSLEKWEARSARTLGDPVRRTLAQAFDA